MKHKTKIDWKYSIREVILIVIGISIAFGLDNWNQKRQLRNDELSLLREFSTTLRNDSLDIDANIFQCMVNINSTKIILDAFNDNTPYHDSLIFHFSAQLISTLFFRNDGPYEVLKTKGFNLIRNDTLRLEIINLYSVRYRVIDQMETVIPQTQLYQNLFEYTKRNFKKSMNDNFKRNFVLSIEPLDYEKLKQDPEYRLLIEHLTFWNSYKLLYYNNTKAIIGKMMTTINKEIGGHKY